MMKDQYFIRAYSLTNVRKKLKENCNLNLEN